MHMLNLYERLKASRREVFKVYGVKVFLLQLPSPYFCLMFSFKLCHRHQPRLFASESTNVAIQRRVVL